MVRKYLELHLYVRQVVIGLFYSSFFSHSSLYFATFFLSPFSAFHISVGFIMDGNRRYARQFNQKTMVGHAKGFDQLMYVLELCLLLGVRTVTVFAFSLDNFKRSKDEVDGLMNLCREKFSDLQDKSSLLFEKGIRIRIVGDISKYVVFYTWLFCSFSVLFSSFLFNISSLASLFLLFYRSFTAQTSRRPSRNYS